MGTFRVTFGEVNEMVEKDYEKLINRPKIESVELIGDKSFEQLGLLSITNSEIEAILT